MKTPRLLLSAVLGIATAGALSAADVAKPAPRTEVTFVQPEKFTDVKEDYQGTEKGRDAILAQIRDYLVKRADRYVEEGQKLSISVTDVDLAGDFEPWRGPNAMDIRIVKDLYPPRMNLDFKLTDASGKVIREGQRKLVDMAFTMKLSINTNDELRFEKAMLDDWLRREFPRAKG